MPNLTALIVVATVMFCVLGGVTLLAHIYNLNNIKSKTVGDGQHGTARFSTKAEIRKVYRQVPFTPEKWRRQSRMRCQSSRRGSLSAARTRAVKPSPLWMTPMCIV